MTVALSVVSCRSTTGSPTCFARRPDNRARAGYVRAEMYTADASLKAQMRYADKRNSPCVVIQGSNEHERGTVVVKELVEGKKLSSMIGSNQEWAIPRTNNRKSTWANLFWASKTS